MAFAPSISVLTSVYRGEEYLSSFLENLQEQTLFPELELVLVLNEATPVETDAAKQLAGLFPEQVQILNVSRVEPLGASWNRGWRAARAPYLAIWNIDDRRQVDSLQRQLTALEAQPESMLCYGDYTAVSIYGETLGTTRNTPAYSVNHFRRAFAQGGAFWLFRKNLIEVAGLFDEQFRVGVDMEYSFRIAAKALQMVRCEGELGTFTDAAQGLSTREGAQEAIVERTAIQLRYGVYDKVHRELIDQTKRYRLNEFLIEGEWLPVTRYLPEHKKYLADRQYLWLVGSIRAEARNLLERMGILPKLYKAQDKILKREI